MKRLCIVGALLLLSYWVQAQHPRIYVSPEDHASICAKIDNETWAKSSFDALRRSVEKYVDRHIDDPEWIVSRLAMYWKEGERYTQCYLKKQDWDRGEGNAPVPTVRMPGMRTWNKYANVPLEDRTPYNETGDMWGRNRLNPSEPPRLIPYKESGHMIRGNNVEILTLAENAAFVYWITGEEKFARFAADIFNTWLVGTYYMNPILDPEKSTGSAGGWAPGGICGYYDYEQIHDDLVVHAAIVYDFLYDYLATYPHPHLSDIDKNTKEVADVVFKRFIDIGMVRGGKSGNWNVNGWNMILHPILALDGNEVYPDGKGREYYLHYLVEESTPYHDAIPDILKTYDAITGLWPESPGYAFGTVQSLLAWAEPLRRAGVDIIAQNPILQKAAEAVFPWMDDAANMVVFGDTRGGSANFLTFEYLLSYYSRVGNSEGADMASSALNKALALKKYNRSHTGWQGLCTFVATIPDVVTMAGERASYSPHHRFITMKNWNTSYKMMAALYGGVNGYHLTANGLALQLYAYGYALAPDAAAYESYWSRDKGYHQSATGSNTIMPGYTHGEIYINAMEPMVDTQAFTATEALSPHLNFADVSAAEKRRVVAVATVGDSAGYYVDIFRSDLDDNDYLFHNVGNSLALFDDDGAPLPGESVEKITPLSRHAYNFFTDIYAKTYSCDFRAEWALPQGIAVRLFMTGNEGRTLYRMSAPPTTLNGGLTPDNCSKSPDATPTLLVRQEANNAAKAPFMAVYEAFKDGKSVVADVASLDVKGDGVGIEVALIDGCKDYYVSAADDDTELSVKKLLSCKALFARASVQDNQLISLYLGCGTNLKCGKWSIESVDGKSLYATVYRENGNWYCSTTGKIRIVYRKKSVIVEPGIAQPLTDL